MAQQTAQANGARFVELHMPFKDYGSYGDDLLAGDGDHPCAAGHALISNLPDAAEATAAASLSYLHILSRSEVR